jgi:hypothetical protein
MDVTRLIQLDAGSPPVRRGDYRERVIHAELCMEEAAIITWAVSGLTACAHVVAADIGLGHLLPLDPMRLIVWSMLGFGLFKHRAWPAYVLLLDIAGRVILTGTADPMLLPAAGLVGALTVRGLLAELDVTDPPPVAVRPW